MYTYTDMGALVFELIPTLAGAHARRSADVFSGSRGFSNARWSCTRRRVPPARREARTVLLARLVAAPRAAGWSRLIESVHGVRRGPDRRMGDVRP